MIQDNVLIIIPARYGSTRFPGKPLVKIFGKPMIQHVYEKARNLTENVYVATDDISIYSAVEDFEGNVVLTSTEHQSGTDRCMEAYRLVSKEKGRDYDVVINVQGDEPFIQPEQIGLLVDCFNDINVEIGTLVKEIEDYEDVFNPNKVKVVFDCNMHALYFSRSPIPYLRGVEQGQWLNEGVFYKHIGMYGYRTDVLKKITLLEQSRLEKSESLEQLRWLENGYKLAVRITGHESIGIDTPEDLERITSEDL